MAISIALPDWLLWSGRGALLLLLLVASLLVVRGQLARYPRRRFGLISAVAVIQLLVIATFAFDYWDRLVSAPYLAFLTAHNSPFFTGTIWHQYQTMLAGWAFTAVLFIACWYYFLKRKHGVLLDEFDVFLLVVGAAVVGWPSALVFLAAVFALTVLGMVILVLLRKRSVHDRLIVTPFILPAAMLTILYGDWLLLWTYLVKIRF
ncbi:MAG: hypothetical protein HY975_00590 [Candidatus Kerfeldbacteria bacterium]|nr:hypothetical protein [Candidatus Kerfeldbacteria bacterium]